MQALKQFPLLHSAWIRKKVGRSGRTSRGTREDFDQLTRIEQEPIDNAPDLRPVNTAGVPHICCITIKQSATKKKKEASGRNYESTKFCSLSRRARSPSDF
jgi:hypothetical protein